MNADQRGFMKTHFNFSNWMPWVSRKNFPNCKQPGVYLLAHFEQPPLGPADPLSKEIVYIGETCDQDLAKRWRQFNRSASTGLKAHSGGRTYHANRSSRMDQLFVAAFIPETKDFPDLQIRFLERKAILDYAMKYESLPACNKK
jgi:hypothetical protein